jgi:hypothetical protein
VVTASGETVKELSVAYCMFPLIEPIKGNMQQTKVLQRPLRARSRRAAL